MLFDVLELLLIFATCGVVVGFICWLKLDVFNYAEWLMAQQNDEEVDV